MFRAWSLELGVQHLGLWAWSRESAEKVVKKRARSFEAARDTLGFCGCLGHFRNVALEVHSSNS